MEIEEVQYLSEFCLINRVLHLFAGDWVVRNNELCTVLGVEVCLQLYEHEVGYGDDCEYRKNSTAISALDEVTWHLFEDI